MMENTLTLVGIIPAMLVVLAGMLVRHVGSDHAASRRFMLFLLAMGVLLSTAVLVAAQIEGQQASLVLYLLVPPLTGVVTIILLRLERLAHLSRGAKVAVALLGLVVFVIFTWRSRYGVAYAIVSDALLLAVLWVLVDRFGALGIAFSLVSLVFLVLFGVVLTTMGVSELPDWMRVPLGVFFLVLPKVAIALAAALISAGLKLLPRPEKDNQPRAALALWFLVAWRWALAIILLGTLGYIILWVSIWDQTSDGMGGLWFSQQAGLIAVAMSMLMGLLLSGRRRWAGLGFAVLVPVLMLGAFEYGWGVSYHVLTEARAARIQRAVERFHDRSGRYPGELGQLVPRHLLWIPKPVILQGYDWCYQGSEDGYRLDTFYREFWGRPLSLRMYASAGSPPESGWACEEKLAELKARRDPPPIYERGTAPTREPLPTSAVLIPRTPVQPLIKASTIAPGTWSVDGRYLVFSSLDTSQDPPLTTLSFLDAASGGLCQADERYPPISSLRGRHAWLPDGRLLFLSQDGEMYLLKPCEAGTENVTERYPARFSEVAAYEVQSGRVLLKSQSSFWIMDGDNLEAHPIPDVSPNPYELHWDDAAWSSDGERLVISRLNGRDKKAGSTLYVVAGDTGEVVKSLPLKYATDQHAPGVEWLAKDELLLHSGGVLTMVDLRSDPPSIVNVLKDIFALDIADPFEISVWTSVVHPDAESYHLAVRVNHPRNQDVYLYHSETGSAEVLRHELDMVLFFPDGEWTELRRMPGVPTQGDQYQLVWVGAPQDARRLVVEGHTPRHYPTLHVRYLPYSSQMAFSSSQGVSLVSIPDGELLHFWELVGAENSGYAYVYDSPDGKALVVTAERVALYFIPLPRGSQ